MKYSHLLSMLSAILVSCAAQASVLTTTYTGNTGQNGIMFDVVTLGGALDVTGFDLSFRSSGIYTVNVYEKAGTWVGYDHNASAWTLIDSGTVTAMAANTSTFFNVADFILGATSTTALYITTTIANEYLTYSTGTGVGNIAAANADLEILQGAGKVYPFSSVYTYAPRVWNGSILYTPVPEPATLGLLGLGLAGLGLSRRRKA